MRLAVGDSVVYRNHGVGRVAGREKQVVLGEKQEVVVVAFDDGLTITLPVELAQAQLRPLVTDTDLRLVGKALRGEVPLSGGNWLSRRRETLEKLAEGTPVALAQIVSEGAQRERLQLAQGRKPPLASN